MPLRRASRFFEHDIWVTELDEARGLQGVLVRTLRILSLAVRGFFRDHGLHRASALAFDSVLGLLPFLVLLVAVLKGFGAYRTLMHETLRPGIVETLGAMGDRQDLDVVTLRGAFLLALDLVDSADLGTIGIVGLALLLYIVVLVLVSVEQSLNHVFGVERARSIPRKVADYSAILFITPLCGVLAAAVSAAARRVEWLGGSLALQVSAVMVMGLGLTMLYMVMPFTRVRLRSALVGGGVGGVLWYVVLLVEVHFQLGVARYNALYSTFAAIPLFLIWVFFSWVVVLLGAEITAAHQNMLAYRWRIRGSDADHAARAFVAVRALAEIVNAFVTNRPPRTLRQLSRSMKAPEQLVKEILDVLASGGMLARALRRGQPAFVLARDIEPLRVDDVLTALERASNFHLGPAAEGLDGRIQALLDDLQQARREAAANLRLRDLGMLVEVLDPAAAEAGDSVGPPSLALRDAEDTLDLDEEEGFATEPQ